MTKMVNTSNLYNNPPIFYFIEQLNTNQTEEEKPDVLEKANQIIDLIKFRVGKQPLDFLIYSLRPNFFEVKLELIDYLLNEENLDLKEIHNSTIDEIVEKTQFNSISNLRDTVIDVLEAHFKISTPAVAFAENVIGKTTVKSYLQYRRSFKELETITNIYYGGIPQAKNMFKRLSESLKFDIALIIADLALRGQIETLDKEFESQLSHLLKSIVSKFGALSIVTGTWQPDEDDTSQLVNNMRILSGVYQVEMGKTKTISLEGMRNMVLS